MNSKTKRIFHVVFTALMLLSMLAGTTAAQTADGMAMAPRPERIDPAAAVRDGMSGHDGGAHAKMDLDAQMENLKKARTVRGLNHVAGGIFATLHAMESREAESRRAEFYRAYNEAARQVAPSLSAGLKVSGQGQCMLDFDTQSVLDMFPDDAEYTFSSPPHWSEACGDGMMQLQPTVYSHYHLSYEDETISCIDTNTGKMGRPSGSDCIPVADPTLEPRHVSAHAGNEVMVLTLQAGNAQLPFQLHSLANVGNEPVRLRYRTSGGQWYQIGNLGGNTTWNLGNYLADVVEVQITNSDTSLSCGPDWITSEPASCPVDLATFHIDNLSISPQ